MELTTLLNLYKNESIAVMQEMDLDSIARLTELVLDCYHTGSQFFACGNGGNAAYVANLITDLNLHPFVSENKAISIPHTKRFKGFNLCDSVSTITGILNDVGSPLIFTSQLEIYASKGDVLLGFSGSGNSENIVNAFQYAKFKGMRTALITRKQEGKIHHLSDVVVCVPGYSTYPGQTGGNNNNFHYEDMISKISHMITGILKKEVNENQAK